MDTRDAIRVMINGCEVGIFTNIADAFQWADNAELNGESGIVDYVCVETGKLVGCRGINTPPHEPMHYENCEICGEEKMYSVELGVVMCPTCNI